jgi:tol-pal system protein YbgF
LEKGILASLEGLSMRYGAGAVVFLAIAAIGCPVAAQAPAPHSAASGDPAALASRVDRLEQEVANLQGVISAVESLAKSNAGRGSGYAAVAAGGGASTEQIRQLSEQIADLTQRLERLEARGGTPAAAAAPPTDQTRYGAVSPPGGFDNKEQLPPLSTQPGTDARQAAVVPIPTGPVPSQQRPSASPPGGSRALFDQGYAALNQREYAAAETYFQQFLDQYPGDPLAGSAQYWYGETAFVSGEYRTAADRFLKTFTSYPNSERAPEALLKLAISLRRLGENSAACDSFAELGRRFPQAPKSVQQRAETEKKRANCS